jgi:hypothetical protein
MNDSINPLPHKHLTTLTLDVDIANAAQIGSTPVGRRTIAPVTGGTFAGERLNGKVLPGGADWVLFRSDGAMLIDVRLTLETDDGALLYLAYEGRFIGEPDAMMELAQGKALDPDSYSLATVARFESGDDRYSWLNTVVAVGTGEQTGFNPKYTIYEIR